VTEYPFKTDDLALELDCSRKTIRRKAAILGIGIDLGGRAGFRYSNEDRRRLLESLKPDQPAPRKRKATRRAA
jgi:hypothetical protein